MKTFFKNEKGITLITLIVTIIILLIIAVITIRQGMISIGSTQSSVIESNLKTVQQVVLQEHSKAMVKKDGGETTYIGTKQTPEDIAVLTSDIPINLQNKTTNPSPYYILNKEDLNRLGVEVPERQEYLVDYSNGEIWDITNKTYDDGTYAYLNGITDVVNTKPEDFLDSNIDISFIPSTVSRGDWYREYSTNEYKLTLKINDTHYSITSTSDENNILNMNDYNVGNLILKLNDEEVEIKNVEFINTSNDREYNAIITIDGSEVDSRADLSNSALINETTIIATVLVKPNSVIDENGEGNENVELSTIISTDAANPDVQFGIAVKNNGTYDIKYETKTTKYPNGYVDENGKTWGTAAIVKIKLENDKTGLSGKTYDFDYVWKVGEPPTLEEFTEHLYIKTKKGSRTAEGSLYVDSGTGEGTLYVKPSVADSGDFVNSDVITASINLDNTAPAFRSKWDEAYADTAGICGKYNKENGLVDSYTHVLYTQTSVAELFDEETGLMVEDTSTLETNDFLQRSQGFSKNKEEVVDTFGTYSSEYITDYNYHNRVNANKHAYGIDIATWDGSRIRDFISGEYYLWEMNFLRYVKGKEIELTDNVGNVLEQPWADGPIKIDGHAPELNEDENTGSDWSNGNAVIKISDDYSGLVDDPGYYNKIKYAWVDTSNDVDNLTESDYNTLTSDMLSFIDPTEFQINGQDTYKNMVITLVPPSSDKSLYINLKEFTDMAKNPMNKDFFLSSSSMVGNSDVVVTVNEKNQDGEYNKVGYPITVELNLETYSGGLADPDGVMKITEVSYSHIGLNDNTRVFYKRKGVKYKGSQIFTFETNMNGPIKITVKGLDSLGNIVTLTELDYTIQYVQETVLHIDLSETGVTKYNLPIVKYVRNMLPESEVATYRKENSTLDYPLYVDWGDGQCQYITKSSFVDSDTFGKNSDYVSSQWYTWFIKDNGQGHNYGSISEYTIKISGIIPSWYGGNLKFDYDESTGVGEYLLPSSEYTNCHYKADRTYLNDYNNSKKAIIGVKQFGVHYATGSSIIKDEKKEMFLGCTNLQYTPKEGITTNEYDIELNANAFEYVPALDGIFKYTNITTIYGGIFSKVKVCNRFNEAFAYTNLPYIPFDLFTFSPDYNPEKYSKTEWDDYNKEYYKNSIDYTQTFYHCKNLRTIPNSLFKNEDDRYYFTSTFEGCEQLNIASTSRIFEHVIMGGFTNTFKDCVSITEIPIQIFEKCEKAVVFRGTFQNTGITEVSAHLFDNNPRAEDISDCFNGCQNLTRIGYSRLTIPDYQESEGLLFLNNYQLEELYGTFENCPKLEIIPTDLLKTNTELRKVGRLFKKCVSIEEIPEHFFDNCPKVYIFDETFYGTGITRIPDALFEKSLYYGSNQEEVEHDIWFQSTFAYCQKLDTVSRRIFAVNEDTNAMQYDRVDAVNRMFQKCTSLTKVDGPENPASGTEYGLFENFEVRNLSWVFEGCISLEEVDKNTFLGCSKINSLIGVFQNCRSLRKLGKNVFDSFYRNVKEVSVVNAYLPDQGDRYYVYNGVFAGCSSLPLSECPEIWKWSQFRNREYVYEETNFIHLDYSDVSTFNVGTCTIIGGAFWEVNPEVETAIRNYITLNHLSETLKYMFGVKPSETDS